MCVHLYGGNPREGVEVCLWQGCDEDRTKVTFMKQGEFGYAGLYQLICGLNFGVQQTLVKQLISLPCSCKHIKTSIVQEHKIIIYDRD